MKRELQEDVRVDIVTGHDGRPVVDDEGNPQVSVKVGDSAKWQETACRRCVDSVGNYLDAAGNPIDDGAKLAENGETELVSEIAAEIMVGLGMDDEAKKDFGGSSDSMSPKTPPSNGIVGDADPMDSIPIEDAEAA